MRTCVSCSKDEKKECEEGGIEFARECLINNQDVKDPQSLAKADCAYSTLSGLHNRAERGCSVMAG